MEIGKSRKELAYWKVEFFTTSLLILLRSFWKLYIVNVFVCLLFLQVFFFNIHSP